MYDNASSVLAKMATPLLSRVPKKMPLAAQDLDKAVRLLEFDSSTSTMDALTALDHVECQILQAMASRNSAEVQQHVKRQRTIALQLLVRLMDDLQNLAGPKRIRYLTGVNREWNHIDVARLFDGKKL